MQKNKILYIEIKKAMTKYVDEYCSAAGIEPSEIGYLYGFITGNTHEEPHVMECLIRLNQLFFFAGIHLANSDVDFTYKYLTPEERKAKATKNDELIKNILEKQNKPDYMG